MNSVYLIARIPNSASAYKIGSRLSVITDDGLSRDFGEIESLRGVSGLGPLYALTKINHSKSRKLLSDEDTRNMVVRVSYKSNYNGFSWEDLIGKTKIKDMRLKH